MTIKITGNNLRRLIKEELSNIVLEQNSSVDSMHTAWPGLKGNPEGKADVLLSLLMTYMDGEFPATERDLVKIEKRVKALERLNNQHASIKAKGEQ